MRKIILVLLALALLALSLLSLLPRLETDLWAVRMIGFARMQIAAGLILLLVLFLALAALWRRGADTGRGRALLGGAAVLLTIVALVDHGMRLWHYQPLARVMAPQQAACPAPNRLRVLVANVRRTNREAEQVLALVRREKPDVFLALETNDWWNDALNPLNDDFASHVVDVPEEATYFGMHLFARQPLENTEVRFPVGARTPLIYTELMHPAGRIRFFGIHPRPPAKSQPTLLRDATLLQAAIEAGRGDTPAILAGDFNATPWEPTSRRALRLGGLMDPRAGRGPRVSFDAKSWWMKWPLDQILFQPGLSLVDFEVLGAINSDHYPVRADLCIDAAPEDAGKGETGYTIAPRPSDLTEAQATIATARRTPLAEMVSPPGESKEEAREATAGD